jgi:hypothetical protein
MSGPVRLCALAEKPFFITARLRSSLFRLDLLASSGMHHALVDAPWNPGAAFQLVPVTTRRRDHEHEARAACFDLHSRMDDRQSGIRERRGAGSSGWAFEIAGPGCRRQRHCSGTWQCARTQRLDQRSSRYRQCGQSACDTAAGNQPRSDTHLIRSCGWLPNGPGAKSRQHETNATCGIEIPSRGDPSGRQGKRQAAQRQASEHLQGMLNRVRRFNSTLYTIGFKPASICARRGSRNGGSASFSPSVSKGSSVAKPGPSVAISNRMPFGSRKYRLRK